MYLNSKYLKGKFVLEKLAVSRLLDLASPGKDSTVWKKAIIFQKFCTSVCDTTTSVDSLHQVQCSTSPITELSNMSAG